MSTKVCYITTLPSTLEAFCLKSALYNIENAGWDITFVSSYNEEFSKRIPDSIRYVPIEIKRGVSLSGIKSAVELYKFFKKEKFDLVQYATSNASCYASIAARMARVPVRLYCEWGLGYVQLKGKRRWIFETVERFVCRNSTHIRPDSFGNLKIGISEGLYTEKNASVVRRGSSCGVDLKRFDYEQKSDWKIAVRDEFKVPQDAFVFGYAGRFQGDKGLNEFFEAALEICEKNPDVYVVFVGDYKNQEAINQELFNKVFEHKQVRFCGFRRDIERFYAAFDCTVLPSYHEGFPTSIIESQAMGTPAIVTDIAGCIDTIVPDVTGWTVPKADSKALRERMESILKIENIEEFGKSGKEHIDKYYNQEDVFADILQDRKILLDN